MPTWLLFTIAIGAVVRLTRLITADKITEPIRDRLIDHWGEEAKLSYLVSCDYCASIYVAPPVAWAAIYYGDNRVVILILLALTASLIAGIVAKVE